MSVKDKLGNIIKVGQLIAVQPTTDSIICEVVDLKEPSSLAAGKDSMGIPGLLVLVSRHMVPIHPDPRQRVMTAMVVVQTPPSEDKPN